MSNHLSVWQNGSANATRKSEINDLVLALRERAPWAVARRYLSDAGIDGGLGWNPAIDEVQYLADLSHIDIDSLYQSYFEHVCCGEKSIRYYDLPLTLADNLRSTLDPASHHPRLKRPRARPMLTRASLRDPELVSVTRRTGGIVAVFATIRSFEERKEIEGNDLPDSVRDALTAFDEIIGIRKIKYEAHGSIWIPNKGRTIEVTVDAHVDQTIHGLDDFHQRMYAQVHALSGATAVVSPINLFRAIKGIYSSAEEGILSELSFATTTGSVKHERMRSHESLRQEKYHVGGLEALATEIEPFRISVFWRRQSTVSQEISLPQLSLLGTLSMIGVQTPQLFTAGVSKASGFDDFEFVRSKLSEYS